MFLCENCDILKDKSEAVPFRTICFDCLEKEKEEL